MKYKKIYLEITNNCNLKCDFCIKNNRNKQYMDFDNFRYILHKLKPHTDYLYFHLMGEPLLHPNINEYIDHASKDFFINITTNGYLIKRIKNNKNIRQINISLHSFNAKYISIDKYMSNILESIEELLKNDTYVSLRFWVKNDDSKSILKFINNKYNTNISISDIENKKTIKIVNNLFINNFHEFIWPSYDNNFSDYYGTCYALKDHIGILVDGTVVPCCLDSAGCINLGNIYKNDLIEIINSEYYQRLLIGFQNKKKIEKLCQKCRFLE